MPEWMDKLIMWVSGSEMKSTDSLTIETGMLSWPDAVPVRRLLIYSVISSCVVDSSDKELTKFPLRNEWIEFDDAVMFFARLGPIFEKYSQKRFVISSALDISRLSYLKVDGSLAGLFFLFKILFKTFHELFMFDLERSSLVS